MRRALAIIATAALALVLAGFGSAPQEAQAAPYAHCDSLFNTPDLGMDCTVTVVNNLDLTTGATNSTTTYLRCSGAANSPLTCEGPVTLTSAELVTSVSQCNSSLDGGGASMHCSVDITNNIVGDATAITATVNQCNDSLDGGGIVLRACSPDPASTSGAAINQCNNSVNGGGSSLTCTVLAGMTSSALAVTVSQCNYSANGGGSLIVCTTAMRTNITPAVVEEEEEGGVTTTEVVLSEAEVAAQRAAQPGNLASTGGDLEAATAAVLMVTIGALLLGAAGVSRRVRMTTG